MIYIDVKAPAGYPAGAFAIGTLVSKNGQHAYKSTG